MTTVSTRLGDIKGGRHGNVDVFSGIRFGQAPIGELRFKPARPVVPWQGTLDATRMRSRSLQPESTGFMGELTSADPAVDTFDEDCLFLNIYTPQADNKQRPVLFWIHGGSFTMGSGSEYNGATLAQQGNVVVVTINYRLGLLGFLDVSAWGADYAGSASNGISDQILALQWVRDNISDYGGDPANVTIFGESAGGAAVNCIIASPSADGLYHKAISHSGGSPFGPPTPLAPMLAGQLDVTEDELQTKLASMSGEEILATQLTLGAGGGSCIDGTVVTRSTAQAFAEQGGSAAPYIAGSNANEGTLFTMLAQDADDVFPPVGHMLASMVMEGADTAPYIDGLRKTYPDQSPRQHYEHVWNDMFRRASINNAQAASTAGVGGWLYRFDMPSSVLEGKLGATHASEIGFTFNVYADPTSAGLKMHDANDPAVVALAKAWSDTVITFARTGNPNGAGLPQWDQYDTNSRQSLVMGAQSRIAGPELDDSHRRLWGDA